MKTIEEKISVMQAFADGKEVEYKENDGEWVSVDEPLWNWNTYDYRVKGKITDEEKEKKFIDRINSMSIDELYEEFMDCRQTAYGTIEYDNKEYFKKLIHAVRLKSITLK